MSKMTNKLLSIGVLATGLMLTASVAQAQNYNVTTDTQAFTTIVGNGETVIGTGDDDAFLVDDNGVNLSLPFDFVYMGSNRTAGTTFSVCTNGFMSFDVATNSASRVTNAIPSTVNPNDVLFLFHDDLDSRTTGNISFLVQGTTPNRTLTIEFTDCPLFGLSTTALTGQIVLFEGTNVIRFNYDQNAAGFSGNGVGSVGIEGPGGTVGFEGVAGSPSITDVPTTNVIFTPVIPQGIDIQANGAPTPSTLNPIQGTSFTVDCELANLGSDPTGAFDLEVFSGTTSIGTLSIANLAGLTTNTFTVTATYPAGFAGGPASLTFVADTGLVVTELDENNNTSGATSVFVGPRPDITGTIVSTNGAVTVQQGAMLTVTITLQNLGGGATGAFSTDIFLSDNNVITGSPTFDIFFATVPVPNGIPGNGSVTMDITAMVDPTAAPDDYFVGFIADTADVVDESDETNNDIPSAVAEVTVVPPPVFDLEPTVVTPQATTVVAGNPISVDRTVANNGADATSSSMSQILLSTDAIADAGDVVVLTETIATVAGNDVDTGTSIAMIPANTTAGTYFLIYVADSGMDLSETDETNNELASVQIMVNAAGAGPDLTVPTASLSAQSAAANSTIMVTRTITNGGNASAGAFDSGVYFSTDNVITTSDVKLVNFNITSIASSASNGPESITVTIPNVTPGTYFIGVIADDGGDITEADEGNNVSTALSIVVNNRLGDIDGDTIVNIMDIQICINQSIGLIPTTGPADVNNDGNVNVLDVQSTINEAAQPTP